MRHIDTTETELLKTIGDYLVRRKEYGIAAQLFLSINDIESLIDMHVKAKQWDDVGFLIKFIA